MDWRFITRRSAMLAAVVGAGAVLAVPAGASAASTMFANGSSFQGTAQPAWINAWPAHSALSPAPTSSSIRYSATGSGQGLDEFGNNHNRLDPTQDPAAGGALDGYVGTDDPPSAVQLGNARIASGGANELTVPVTQAPVAVLLSLPAGCTISGQVELLNTTLEAAVAGNLAAAGGYGANTFGSLLADSAVTPTAGGGTGNACDSTITLNARASASGTSYAFKSYMSQVRSTDWSSFLTDDSVWPTTATVARIAGNGGALAGTTAATPGSIAYANLADAISNGGWSNTATPTTFDMPGTSTPSASHDILYALVQDDGLGTDHSAASFSDPVAAARAGNCPTNPGNMPGWAGAPSDGKTSWLGVLASDPNVKGDAGGDFYPACAVTYDLAWDNYSTGNLATAYGANAASIQATVKDYLGFVASDAGQAVSNAGIYYNALPASAQRAAQATVAMIGQQQGQGGGGPQQGGGTTTTTGSTPPPPPPVTTAPVVTHDRSATNLKPKLTVSASAITVSLACPKTKASCTGKVTLTAKTKVKKGKKTVTRTITIGTGHVTLKGGQSKKLVVKLNSAGKKALKSSKKLAVTVKVAASDTYGGKKTTTLHATVKQPAAKKKH